MTGIMRHIANCIIARSQRRPPDRVIGGYHMPYLRRWWLIPRNPVFNIYLHQFLRSDDDRALHDHPWANCSILLRGEYMEHTDSGVCVLKAGDIKVRMSGKMAHRIELFADRAWNGDLKPGTVCYAQHQERPVWTLFITGPRYREWGFWCPHGWVHWKAFTASDDPGAIGKGCDQ